MSGAIFEPQFRKLHRKLRKRLEAYIKNPEDAKAVHDIRTSIRRMESMFTLLGKKDRKANRKRIEQYKDFFKSNSKVRDWDIIMARLGAHSADSRPLVTTLKRRRNSESAKALAKAKKLKKAGGITAMNSGREELKKRSAKVVQRLHEKLNENLSIALSDRNKVEELHSLRKDLKKLRYILESLDVSASKTFALAASKSLGLELNPEILQEFQDLLGDIHDSDITLDYLKSSKSAVAVTLYDSESKVRESIYARFTTRMKSGAAAYSKTA